MKGTAVCIDGWLYFFVFGKGGKTVIEMDQPMRELSGGQKAKREK